MRTKQKALVYLRVSGKGQLEGDGFTRQLEAVRQYAKAGGIELGQVFREEGVSGTKELENRPALQELLEALAAGDVKLVLIEKLDRLARDLMVQETIISDMRKQGFELVSVAEPDLCSDDPSRKLIRQIFGAIAEYDRAMVVLKLRGARQRMKARTGSCEGKKPFGSREGEAATIARMKELRAAGQPYEAVAAALDREGHKPRHGDCWNPLVISRILRGERQLPERLIGA